MADQNQEVQEKQGGSKMLLIMGLLNTLLVVGLLVYVVFLKKDPPPQVIVKGDNKIKNSVNKDDDQESEEEKKKIGEIYELKGIIVNLNEPGGNRMLKISASIEYKDKVLKDILKKRESQIRSEIIIYLSGLSYAQTVGVSQKENILKVIKKKVNKLLNEGKIRNVYFSEFVVQ